MKREAPAISGPPTSVRSPLQRDYHVAADRAAWRFGLSHDDAFVVVGATFSEEGVTWELEERARMLVDAAAAVGQRSAGCVRRPA